MLGMVCKVVVLHFQVEALHYAEEASVDILGVLDKALIVEGAHTSSAVSLVK